MAAQKASKVVPERAAGCADSLSVVSKDFASCRRSEAEAKARITARIVGFDVEQLKKS